MSTGYIKLFRSLKQSSFYKDSEYVHLWVHLLMSVNRTEKRLKLEKSNQFIDLHPGQVLTSRDKLAEQTGIHRSKVDRILKAFQSEHQVEQQTFSKYRIISITNWWEYQVGEQQSEPQVSTKRAASEPQVSTNKKEEKEENKEEKPTTTPRTKTELTFLRVFDEKEELLRGIFPQHPYEVVKEGVLAHWRNKPPPMDPYDHIYKWFQRQHITPSQPYKPKPQRGLSDDFEKALCSAD